MDASMVQGSMSAWRRERQLADQRFSEYATLDQVGSGNGRSFAWNLSKLVGEYGQHNGPADLLRERIDGVTGE